MFWILRSIYHVHNPDACCETSRLATTSSMSPNSLLSSGPLKWSLSSVDSALKLLVNLNDVFGNNFGHKSILLGTPGYKNKVIRPLPRYPSMELAEEALLIPPGCLMVFEVHVRLLTTLKQWRMRILDWGLEPFAYLWHLPAVLYGQSRSDSGLFSSSGFLVHVWQCQTLVPANRQDLRPLNYFPALPAAARL